ncbi:MAG: hypothetical protein ABFD89_01665 [Bryobacteraceae bacterium]
MVSEASGDVLVAETSGDVLATDEAVVGGAGLVAGVVISAGGGQVQTAPAGLTAGVVIQTGAPVEEVTVTGARLTIGVIVGGAASRPTTIAWIVAEVRKPDFGLTTKGPWLAATSKAPRLTAQIVDRENAG